MRSKAATKNSLIAKDMKNIPQGGVVSPLLANLVGDIIDKELEKAGYKFVRYTDDFFVGMSITFGWARYKSISIGRLPVLQIGITLIWKRIS